MRPLKNHIYLFGEEINQYSRIDYSKAKACLPCTTILTAIELKDEYSAKSAIWITGNEKIQKI